MMLRTLALHAALFALVWLSLASGAWALPVVKNGSFEDNQAPIQGLAGYVAEGNHLAQWQADPSAGRNTTAFPFFDNGAPPDGQNVCFIQNRSAIRQVIRGFVAGQVYRLTLHANGRASDVLQYGQGGGLLVMLNGTPLIERADVRPVDASGRHDAPFHIFTADFRTAGGDLELVVQQTSDAPGISVLVDNIGIVAVPRAQVAPQVIEVNHMRVVGMVNPIPEADLLSASWVWYPEEGDPRRSAPPGERFFRTLVSLPDVPPVAEATLVLTADDVCRVWWNGVEQGWAEGFRALHQCDLTASVVAGPNALCIAARNGGTANSPAGLVGALVIRFGDGTTLVQPIDDSWRCSDTAPEGWLAQGFDDGAWPRAREIAKMGDPPWGAPGFLATEPGPGFPEFVVPGREHKMDLLRRLFRLHYRPNLLGATLWEAWLPMSTLWPAVGSEQAEETGRSVLSSKRMDAEGYVSTHQHRGLAHAEGWPFPTWGQSGGTGWHFSIEGHPYAGGMPLTTDPGAAGWLTRGCEDGGADPAVGWRLRLTEADATLTSPEMKVDSLVAPFIRIEWDPTELGPDAHPYLEWTTAEAPAFGADRRMEIPPPMDAGMAYPPVPLHRHPAWGGMIARVRIGFGNVRPCSVTLKEVITAVDSRHQVNNPNYLQGCRDYLAWTGDGAFLSANIRRMRQALAYAITEFRTRESGCVDVPWAGHDGLSGLVVAPDGSKTIRPGHGIGGNYWDLLPIGAKDALATTYFIDALRGMAEIERYIESHPELGIEPPDEAHSAQALLAHAEEVCERARNLFWNPATGRFVACVDREGVPHDYGFTFVNLEAIHYGLATDEQAASILDWVTGKRAVEGDTSQGEDIYHWRFAPRATTKRNVEWYVWAWTGPEGIPWGYQVQDGGAVLGFSYHDLMARLKVLGPDNAWERLQAILAWFEEVLAEGGYREYYRDPARGTLQGGGPPGGLGMDQEFIESVLVPQVMLYGFMGLEPRLDGLSITPRLPSDWPELRITGVRYRDLKLDLTATAEKVTIVYEGEGAEDVLVRVDGAEARPLGEGERGTFEALWR